MRPPSHPAAVALLRIPALAYALAVRWRNNRYDRPGASIRVPFPVVSVGNVTVGGTGKTPLVAWLAQRIVELGRKPAIVSRGYGGRAGAGPLVAADERGPRVGPRTCGDEPFLLHRLVPEALVIVGADRVAGVRAAAGHGAAIAILDDGFQHRRLARDLDVVVLDGRYPFGNGHLLPAGTLREPISSLARAGVVVIHRHSDDVAQSHLTESIRRHNPSCSVVTSASERVGFFDSGGARVDPPERVLSFSGIGRPETFRRDLLEEGIDVAAVRVFDDHHPYTRREIAEIAAEAARLGAVAVTTEKDLARLADPDLLVETARLRPIALRIATTVHEPERLVAPLRRLLDEAR